MRWGARRGLAHPRRRSAGTSGLGEATKTIPKHILKIWDDLPRRTRQRARRSYFRDQATDGYDNFLSTIDAHIATIESALVEFFHATAASLLGPLARSSMKRTHNEAPYDDAPAIVTCTCEH